MHKKSYNFKTPGKQKVTLSRGIYKFECWGASGGSLELKSSSGAYVSGTIFLIKPQDFFLFIGQKGIINSTETTFNGGGAAMYETPGPNTGSASFSTKLSYSASGGGASDIRIVDGDWNEFNSLKSRIIVASGGGGEVNFKRPETNPIVSRPTRGGHGGTLIGEDGSYSLCNLCSEGEYTNAKGGEQKKGGSKGGGSSHAWGNDGKFGSGGKANKAVESWPSSGGGSGYFGGGSGGVSSRHLGAGAGGSSFVSGCSGCQAITSDSLENNIQFSGNVHYLGFVFTNIVMKEGAEVERDSMDGEIRITQCDFLFCTKNHNRTPTMIYFILITLDK